jgi:hypothetical protein
LLRAIAVGVLHLIDNPDQMQNAFATKNLA